MDYIKTELKGVVGETYVKPQGRITLTKTEAPAEEPAKPAEPAQPSTPAQPAKPADGDGGETSYTVVSGDCLWNIAYRHYGSGAKFTMIAEANGLKDPYLINIGHGACNSRPRNSGFTQALFQLCSLKSSPADKCLPGELFSVYRYGAPIRQRNFGE